MSTPGLWARAAARNNAAWCDTMCRAHGLGPGDLTGRVWTHPRRTPPYYPDAVTLVPGTPAHEVLDAIDLRTPGCSVKDGFATLDLTPHGFRPLFDAQWIHRPATPPGDTAADTVPWEPVRTAAALADWETAWSDGADPMNLFRPALLDDPATTVLAGHAPDGRTVAGAVVTLSATPDAGPVVGVSNVFATGPGADPWPGCLAAIARRWPGTPVVGYEHGDDLTAALRHGFTTTGTLRVWVAAP
ncbi:hypothetical protein [Streptomyces ficellus]|uniref:Uncharacterized protein n=1 Tax=Streptomyces ficellus TaxID=1977088 RepID=A0A6I6FN09_9ACTN|nr:hypothetical protein [Streptomyces ficellus]QGV80755.1 hypothetical protein EIZ62_22815 [Streptomyces ficellus]